MVAVYKHPEEQHAVLGSAEQRRILRMQRLLTRFEPISLAEMDHVALLNRTDTKYILRVSQLTTILQALTDQYQALDIQGTRLNHYQTLYFDTPDFALYRQHHNGVRARYKVRMREYVDSDLTYWEVKCKTNQERTVKARLKSPEETDDLEQQVTEFIGAHVPVSADELEPKLWNKFMRITLVSKHFPERLTLDMGLEFGWGDASVTLPGIAVAEVKQERSSPHSDFVQQMRRLGIRPASFSKYCAGVCLLYDGVKTNNFKSQMRLVTKLMQEEQTHDYVR